MLLLAPQIRKFEDHMKRWS